jgi:hypothetical protein
MASVNQPEVSAPSDDAGSSSSSGFSSLIQTATLEFHASLHLLAERARFLSGAAGVAIALNEDGQFVYRASSGSLVPQAGATADIRKKSLSRCIEIGKTASNSDLVAVPVMRQQKVAGFFELAIHHGNAGDEEVEGVLRLAEMVNTVLDHLEAAEQAKSRVLEPQLGTAPAPLIPPITHTPDSDVPPYSAMPLANIHGCKSCAFPISPGRVLCLDCEERPERTAATQNAADGLFQIGEQESWISTYGYTIASLLVTALAAAIILWLR